ncbi:MAG: multidrug effflux MFS transporter [Tatlockia sp.]|nr:multidrug effflux MFS transporter [Tatlockia sp.]
MVKTKWLMLPLLITLVILPRLSIDFYLPSLPYIGDELQANDTSLQMTLTIFMFGYALSMLIAGPLSDILGRKRVLMYGLIIYLVATLACALSTSIVSLIIARFFQALGGCCGTVIARVMVKDAYCREKQIKILSHLSAAMAICPLLIPILGGTSQVFFGWRAAFYILGFFSLIVLIISKQQLSESDIETRPISLKILLGYYKLLITNRIFIGYSFTIGLAWCDYFAFTLESPFFLQKTLGFNSIIFGVLFSIVVLGYLAGTQITKYFANKVGWDELIFIAIIFCLSGALLLTILNIFLPLKGISLILPMIIIMLGVGIIIPCTQAAVMQPFPKIAGTASGLFFFIQMALGGICGLILQFFEHDTITPMIITILTCSFLLIVIFYQLIWKLKKEEKNEAAQLFLGKL